MTASEGTRQGVRPLIEDALDLFLYTPVGLLASSLEDLSPDDLPELAKKGRGRIGRLLSNARVVGHLTISMGRRTLESELRRWQPPTDAHANGDGGPAARLPAESTDRPATARRAAADPGLPIPDYEALSASQVVRRLAGLGPDELEAVYAHESSTRRRRTILHRIQQLLGHEEAPGPGPATS